MRSATAYPPESAGWMGAQGCVVAVVQGYGGARVPARATRAAVSSCPSFFSTLEKLGALALMGMLRIKNWTKYQHYSDRCPPWIKLHAMILDDPDWRSLSDAGKAHLVSIWLLASRIHEVVGVDAEVPDDPSYLSALTGCRITSQSLQVLKDKGFLVPCKQDASNVLAKCYDDSSSPEHSRDARAHSASVSVSASEEEGVQGEEEIPEPLAASPAFVATWAEWLTCRRENRWSTKPAWAKRQLAMLAEHGPDVARAALEMAMSQGWQSVWPAKVRSEAGNASDNLDEKYAGIGTKVANS